jgi:hypothetical protein
MPVSPYVLSQAFVSFTTVTIAAAYQNPGRALAIMTSNGTNVFTMSPANSFPMAAGTAVTVTSPTLPSIFVGRNVIYTRPTGTAGQFYCYETMSDAIIDQNRMTSATSWSGNVIDLDLDRQFSRAAAIAYEVSFTGYTRTASNFSTGSSVVDNQLTRSAQFNISNGSGVNQQVSHVLAFDSSEVIGVARLASVASIPTGQTLPVSVQLGALSVGAV